VQDEQEARAMEILTVGELDAQERVWFEERRSDRGIESATAGDCLFVSYGGVDEALATIERHPSLAWIHTRAAGVRSALLQACRDRGLTLTNGSGAHGSAIAEYVVCALLCLYKHVPELLDNQQRGVWPSNLWLDELRGKTVGILGLGALGRSCARLLSPFGTRLIGLRRTIGAVPEIEEVFPIDQLAAVLPQLSALVIAAPLTDGTRGLIGRHELSLLAPEAVLINVGRGPIIDEEALADALTAGRLRGAALDVFSAEPLPPESPLWAAPNLIMSGHRADATPQTAGRELDVFATNLERWIAGVELRNVVDLEHGY
jgi:phosphoglycerate dehydrogenase-like enzyme